MNRSRRPRPTLARTLLLSLSASLALASPALADRIYLEDGRVLEGRARRTGTSYVIETRHGAVRVPLRDVKRIEASLTREEDLARRLAQLDQTKSAPVAALARWCREQRFVGKAKELEALAFRLERKEREVELARQLADLDRDDVAGLWRVSRWARSARLGKDAKRLSDRAHTLELSARIQLAEARGREVGLVALARDLLAEPGASRRDAEQALQRALILQPDHAEARRLLRQERFRGAWTLSATVRETLAREHAQAQRAKGLVLHEGSWITPERRQKLKAAEVAARQAAALEQAKIAATRAEAEASRARAGRERAEGARQESAAEESRARATAALAEAQRLKQETAQLQAQARQVAADQRIAVARLRGDVAIAEADVDAARSTERQLRGTAGTPPERLKRIRLRRRALETRLRELRGALQIAEQNCP